MAQTDPAREINFVEGGDNNNVVLCEKLLHRTKFTIEFLRSSPLEASNSDVLFPLELDTKSFWIKLIQSWYF